MHPLHEQPVIAGGALVKLKKMAVERNLFVWGGFVGMGGMSLLALTAMHFGMDTIRTITNLIFLGGCLTLVSMCTGEAKLS